MVPNSVTKHPSYCEYSDLIRCIGSWHLLGGFPVVVGIDFGEDISERVRPIHANSFDSSGGEITQVPSADLEGKFVLLASSASFALGATDNGTVVVIATNLPASINSWRVLFHHRLNHLQR